MLIGQPERDLVNPGLEGDAITKALTSLTEHQRAALMKREMERIKTEPLDRSALDNLSLLESLSNNTSQAEAFALESASRTLRDVQSQLSVLNLYIVKKDYAKAMYHLDSILVSDPQLAPSLFPGVVANLEDDNSMNQFAKTLNRNPPWRGEFFTWLNANDKSDELTFKIFNQLRKQGGEVTTFETLDYLRKIISRRDYDRAYFVWLDSLDPFALRKVGNIFDGDFDLEAKNLYFDWTLYPLVNSEIGIVARRNDPTNRALRLAFYNSTEMFANALQYLRLRSGSYLFTGQEAANGFKTVAGLKLFVFCVDSGALLGESIAFRDSAAWQNFSFEFKVPDEACQTQVLRIQSASPAVLDAKMDGEVLFDSFDVSPADTTPDPRGIK